MLFCLYKVAFCSKLFISIVLFVYDDSIKILCSIYSWPGVGVEVQPALSQRVLRPERDNVPPGGQQ